jgi:putative transposase
MIADYRVEHPDAPIAFLCSVARVNRSWFYNRNRPTTTEVDEGDATSVETVAIRTKIEEIVLEMPGYGYRRVTKQLQKEGWEVNHKRVLRIMREESLLCHLKKRFLITTDSNHDHPTFPNLLSGAMLSRPDQAWQADITYIRLPGGFCYLASLIDSFSRYCVGWHLSLHIDTRLTLRALEMALSRRQPSEGLIHHSDRGIQYASNDYVERLVQAKVQISMSRKGNPYDNAKAESFFKTLKREEVYLKEYQNFAEAEQNVGPFIEAVYNQKRLHSSLGYQAPAEFEATFTSVAAKLA